MDLSLDFVCRAVFKLTTLELWKVSDKYDLFVSGRSVKLFLC